MCFSVVLKKLSVSHEVPDVFQFNKITLETKIEIRSPQWIVLETVSLPPFLYPRALPRLSIMSISPLSGQIPYTESSGIIQIAGQSQSPFGTLATTSTRPYVIDFAPCVVRRADLTGLIIAWVLMLEVLLQSLA